MAPTTLGHGRINHPHVLGLLHTQDFQILMYNEATFDGIMPYSNYVLESCDSVYHG